MRYKNLYEISFQIKKSGWKKYTIHIEAFNKKDAIQKAKELWYDVYDSHMFSIEARRVPLDESIDMKHWFVRVA